MFQRKNKNILNSFESSKDVNGNIVLTKHQIEEEYKIEPAWFNIFGFMYLHLSLLLSYNIVHWNKTLGFGKFYFHFQNLKTHFYYFVQLAGVVGLCTGLGITAGAHRLWAHGSYKPNQKLKVLLLMFQTMAFQNSVIEWVRDHR